MSNPRITSNSTWPRVKKQIFSDNRYQVVPEEKRKKLYDEYYAIVCDIEKDELLSDNDVARQTKEAELRLKQLKKEQVIFNFNFTI